MTFSRIGSCPGGQVDPDVLLDNAARHGQGLVSIALRTIDEHWAEIAVIDQGPGFTTDQDTAFARRSTSTDGHGIGLALAHAEGGRLTITNTAPVPRITLTLRRISPNAPALT